MGLFSSVIYTSNITNIVSPESSKIAFIISLLRGEALQWAEPILKQNGPPVQSLSEFLYYFQEVFGRCTGDPSVSEQLYSLRQGKSSVHDYDLRFRTLAAASRWNEPALLTTYRRNLNQRLQLPLASCEDSIGFEAFIIRSIHLAENLLLPRQPEYPTRPTPETLDESMEVARARLPPAERQRRMTQGLCLYCGVLGHVMAACPIRPPHVTVSSIQILLLLVNH